MEIRRRCIRVCVRERLPSPFGFEPAWKRQVARPSPCFPRSAQPPAVHLQVGRIALFTSPACLSDTRRRRKAIHGIAAATTWHTAWWGGRRAWRRSGQYSNAQLPSNAKPPPKLSRAAHRGTRTKGCVRCTGACAGPKFAHTLDVICCVRKILLLRRGRQRADPQALCQRAVAAAKAAAAQYETPEGTLIDCMCIGQPHDDGEPAPLLEECTQNPDLWKLPPAGSQTRLAFLWHIIKGHRVDGADSCVLRLEDAERRGVPLPPDLAPMVAELIDSGAKDEGALPASQASLVGRV